MPKQEKKVETASLKDSLKHNLEKRSNKSQIARNYQEYQAYGLIDIVNQSLANKFAEKKSIKILNLGCGLAADFFVLQTIFELKNIKIKYVGIEADFNQFAAGNAALKEFSNATIFHLDGASPEKIHAEGFDYQSFDLVMLQHAYLLDEDPKTRDCFITMLRKTVPAFLAPGGYVYASFYTEQESEKFKEIISNLAFCDAEQSPVIIKNPAPHEHFDGQVMGKIANYVYVSQPFQPEAKLSGSHSAADAKSAEEVIRSQPDAKPSSFCSRYGWFVAGGVALAATAAAVTMLSENEQAPLSSDTLFNPNP